MEVPIVNAENSEVAKITLPSSFCGGVNDYLMFDQVIAQQASRRRGTASTKTRGKVRGGGKKPWKQKGTGRARAGSTRSPIWRGGGTIFGPQPRSYAYRLPRKARIAALKSALAQKARDGQVRIIESLAFDEPKTKTMVSLLEKLGAERSALIVTAESNYNVERSARNIPYVDALPVAGLNVHDIIRHELLIIVRDALDGIENRLS